MNPMEKRRLAGYIFILIAIGFFAGSMALSFFTYRMLAGVSPDIATRVSRSILFVGLIFALISLCIGLFLAIKYR
ncbi:MAG: hypothetical protein ACFE9Z_16680 [Promethearchaeota archaeon]